MLTFENQVRMDAAGNHLGKHLGGRWKAHDGKYYDSTGAFMVGELERLDQTLHEPLVAVTWGRDIDLRTDVTMADEVSSYTLSTFGSAGGLGTGQGGATGAAGNGKAWIGRDTTQISNVSVDIAKIAQPLRPWGLELKYTVFELESAAKLGRPIDVQKFNVLQLKHQMDIDEQIYVGDTTMGDAGLVTSAAVTATTLANGVGGSSKWALKTPDEILQDVNAMITTVWARSGWAVMPSRLILPPVQFGSISTRLISGNGSMSILRYVMENSILTTSGKGALEILPVKWLQGAGAGGTIGDSSGAHDRAVVYTKDKQYVRYPMTLLSRTALQFDSIYQKTTYYGKLGVIEIVYPETMGYFDGL